MLDTFLTWILRYPKFTEALLVAATILVALMALRALMAATAKLFAFLLISGLLLAVATSLFIFVKGRAERHSITQRARITESEGSGPGVGAHCGLTLYWKDLPLHELPGKLGRWAASRPMPVLCSARLTCGQTRLWVRGGTCRHVQATGRVVYECRGCGEVHYFHLDTHTRRLVVERASWRAEISLEARKRRSHGPKRHEKTGHHRAGAKTASP